MKDSSEYAVRFKRLCNRLQRSEAKVSEPEQFDVTTELLLGCMSEHMTESKARAALNKLRGNFVDYNELRVTRPAEVIEILGRGFAQSRQAIEQMIYLLRELFDEQDHLDLEHLKGLGKREAKSFFEELEGASPYLVSRVMLRGLSGHSFPVHEQMIKMLQGEVVVDESADAATIQGFLERQISAKRILKVYALLRHHADTFRGPGAVEKATKRVSAISKKTVKQTKKKSKKVARKTSGD
jgi:hypothetical protein